MATDFAFREKAMKELPTSTGVYVLCDLDEVPITLANEEPRRKQRGIGHPIPRHPHGSLRIASKYRPKGRGINPLRLKIEVDEWHGSTSATEGGDS